MSEAHESPAHAAEQQAPTAPPGMPRWVKVGLLVVAILVLLFVVLHLTGVASGPGHHMSSATSGVEGGPMPVALRA